MYIDWYYGLQSWQSLLQQRPCGASIHHEGKGATRSNLSWIYAENKLS
jgi:hypothetical protein